MEKGRDTRAVAIVAFAVIAMTSCTVFGAPPTTRQAQRTLNEAVKQLTQEILKAKGNSDDETLRPQSNFFSASDAGEIPIDVLLDALSNPPARDPRVQSYVSWQLLSAAPDGFDEASAGRAVRIYRQAPVLSARPGISAEDQKELDALLGDATRDDVYELTQQLERLVEKNERANRYMIAYRDEFIRKLPKNYDSIAARLEDLYERYHAGLERKMMQDALVVDIESFARDSRATNRQLESLAETIGRMIAEEGPQYYAEAEIHDGKVRWRKQRDSLRRSKKFKDLVAILKEAASQPRDGGLKFTDE
jgi:hypothetical protein